MQEMAVLEGLDFKNFRGNIRPDPLAYDCQVL